MVYELPDKNEKVTIGGIIYGNPTLMMNYPPNRSLTEVQKSMKSYNQEPKFKRAGLRFSVVMLPENKFFGYDRYSLCSWVIIGYTKEYEKSHPWVNDPEYFRKHPERKKYHH